MNAALVHHPQPMSQHSRQLTQKKAEDKSRAILELQTDETNQFSHSSVERFSPFTRSFLCRQTQNTKKLFSFSFPLVEFLNVILPKCRHVSVMSSSLCCLLIKRWLPLHTHRSRGLENSIQPLKNSCLQLRLEPRR